MRHHDSSLSAISKRSPFNILRANSFDPIFYPGSHRPRVRKSLTVDILEDRSVFFFDLDLAGEWSSGTSGKSRDGRTDKTCPELVEASVRAIQATSTAMNWVLGTGYSQLFPGEK
jgi:hypothetical protein